MVRNLGGVKHSNDPLSLVSLVFVLSGMSVPELYTEHQKFMWQIE